MTTRYFTRRCSCHFRLILTAGINPRTDRLFTSTSLTSATAQSAPDKSASFQDTSSEDRHMSWQSLFAFPIIIGTLIVAQYFVGFDGHGHGAGNPITLFFGLVFIGCGFYSTMQRNALRRKMAARLGLPDNASWADIQHALELKKSSAK